MSYYDHATMIAYRLGPWAPAPEPPLDTPAGRKASELAPVARPVAPQTARRQYLFQQAAGQALDAYQSQAAAAKAGGAALRCSRETRAMVT
ncbi:hypothetical protein OEG86_02990 [Hoeflea alexandrii]|uniref:hypothetical protein n=1 Tax=Hoeflea alexandrii TaxID=288436 RepID=UPI00226D9B9E|nr:hypothetical protein [Hoeflea alexandrii]MCY0151388.1 hypothetical protein [Hoeflea alexandrii]